MFPRDFQSGFSWQGEARKKKKDDHVQGRRVCAEGCHDRLDKPRALPCSWAKVLEQVGRAKLAPPGLQVTLSHTQIFPPYPIQWWRSKHTGSNHKGSFPGVGRRKQQSQQRGLCHRVCQGKAVPRTESKTISRLVLSCFSILLYICLHFNAFSAQNMLWPRWLFFFFLTFMPPRYVVLIA